MSSSPTVYGGWRERRGFGFATLSGPQTLAALVAVVCLLGLGLLVPGLLLVLGPPILLVAALFLVPVRGETPFGMVVRHLGWFAGERRGRHRYAGRGNDALPGALGRLTVVQIEHGAAEFAGLWDEQRGTLSALVPLEPLGPEFVEPEEVDQWVRAWSDWLAHLGYVSSLRHVSVTVDSGPEPWAPQVADASSVAEQVMAELDRCATGRHARARTVLTLTLEQGAREVNVACSELVELVAAASALSRCGVTVLPAMDLAAVSAWVRGCYDPGCQSDEVNAVWLDARPVAVVESWDRVVHDGWFSAGYFWDECPGQAVPATVLSRLLGPADFHKRVTLVYEPVAAHRAAREVDRQAEAAQFRRQYRRRLGRDETARDAADLQRAQQTAREQAAGAGLVDVGLYAVVSAADADALAAGTADLAARAGEARLRLRRGYGSQAAIFDATLAVGALPGDRR